MHRKPEIRGNRIIVPSDQELIGEIDEFVESWLRSLKIDDSVIADIAICATEIANNAIIHGNKEDPDKKVTLELKFADNEVNIIVTDEGKFFDFEHIDNPLDDKNLLREVGRGIFIVRSLMDRVDITPADNGGTVVTLIKKIT